MVRRRPLNLEQLEAKTLLSNLLHRPTTIPAGSQEVQPIPSPGAATWPSGIAASLTTDKLVYPRGQPIRMTFTATNVTDQPLQLDVGPSIDGFEVLQNGRLVWNSNGGINPLFIMVKTLQPGQSLTLKATWDGTRNDGSAATGGTFTVINQLDPQGAVATVRVVPARSQPSPRSLTPSKPRPGMYPIQAAAGTTTFVVARSPAGGRSWMRPAIA
jgi:hypothetical protein